MTDLKCEVKNCRYNCRGLCGLDSIEVLGSEASTRSATSCGSFSSCDDYTEYASDFEPRVSTEIECGAGRCRYNDEGCCSREDVEIDGESADSCSDTCCGSFRSKKR